MSIKSNPQEPPSQIELLRLIGKCLKRLGYEECSMRQMNAMIAAADLLVDAFSRDDTPSVPGSGLAAWIASDDTGLSSRAMARTLAPLAGLKEPSRERYGYEDTLHPFDPADLGRCVRLLDAAPELRPHLPAMAGVSPEWAALLGAWDELEALYREEYPTGSPPRCWDRMQAILDGVKAVAT